MSEQPRRRGRPRKSIVENKADQPIEEAEVIEDSPAPDSAPSPDPLPEIAATIPEPDVVFESRNPEPAPFEINGIRPIRDFSSGRLLWGVPAEEADLFEKHHHVLTNRVRRLAR